MSTSRLASNLHDRAKAYIFDEGEGSELVAELLHELNNKQQTIDGWTQLEYVPGDPSPARLPGGVS